MLLSSDEDGIRTPEEEAGWEWSRKANAVLDRVRPSGPGMSLEEAQLLLRREWRAEFGTDIPGRSLSAFAPRLAEGQLGHVRPAPPGARLTSPPSS
jgi:hypothetical protein